MATGAIPFITKLTSRFPTCFPPIWYHWDHGQAVEVTSPVCPGNEVLGRPCCGTGSVSSDEKYGRSLQGPRSSQLSSQELLGSPPTCPGNITMTHPYHSMSL